MMRLWIGEDDYGTVSDRAGEIVVQWYEDLYPGVAAIRLEPVAENAPVFLSELMTAAELAAEARRRYGMK